MIRHCPECGSELIDLQERWPTYDSDFNIIGEARVTGPVETFRCRKCKKRVLFLSDGWMAWYRSQHSPTK